MVKVKLKDILDGGLFDQETPTKKNALQILKTISSINDAAFDILDRGAKSGFLTPERWGDLTKVHLKLGSKLDKTIQFIAEDTQGEFLSKKSLKKFKKMIRKYLEKVDKIRATF